MTLKVAIVGCGKVADQHVEEIAKLPQLARVVGVCDLEPLMAEQLASRFSIAAHFDEFTRLLEELRPDVVHVTTPPQSHLPLARRALDAGCHVFVEKPLALDYEQAVALVEHARRCGRKLTIGYTFLFDPVALAMRELVQDGVVGDPVHVESYYGYPLAGPYGKAVMADPSHWVHALPGGLFQNNIDHLLYKLVEFIHDDKPGILAFGSVGRPQRFGDVRDALLDELRILVRGNATTAYATFSANARPLMQLVRVYGTRNTLHVDYGSRVVTLEPSSKVPGAPGRLVPPFSLARQLVRAGARNVWRFARSEFHYLAGLSHLLRRFYESIRDDAEPPIAYRDMLRVSLMIHETIRQLRAAP
jgi:predicted dehydrogenase